MGVWLLRFAGFYRYDDPFQVVIDVAVDRMSDGFMGSVGFSMLNLKVERELWAER